MIEIEYVEEKYEKFLKNFEGLDTTNVKNILDNLPDTDKKKYNRVYGIKGKVKEYSSQAEEVIISVKKKLTKKDLKKRIDKSEEETIALLGKLKEEDRNILLKEYYVSEISSKENLSKKDLIRNKHTINKLLYYANNLYVKKDTKNYNKALLKPFYEVLKDYPKDLVLHVVKYNSEEDNALLYKKYGKELDTLNYNMTPKENEKINAGILHVMKVKMDKVLSGDTVFATIDNVFPNMSKEEIFKYLSNANKARLISYFGEELDKECMIRKVNLESLKKLYEEKLEKQNYKLRNITPLIMSLRYVKDEEDTIEEFIRKVNFALSKLNDEERNILINKYGPNLNRQIKYKESTKKECYKVFRVVYKLRYYIKSQGINRRIPDCKPFFERFPNYSKDEVLVIVNSLSEEEKELLTLKYGKDLTEVTPRYTFGSENNDKIKDIVRKIETSLLRKMSEESGILIKKLKIVKRLINTDDYTLLLDQYSANEALAILLDEKAGEIIDDEELFIITGMLREEVKSLRGDILKLEM